MSILDENPPPQEPSKVRSLMRIVRRHPLLVICLGIALAFLLYLNGLSKNPPGFYIDESGIAYNAFLIARTGRGETGQYFPLYFQFYLTGWTQWANPTQIYLLAIPFRFFQPSILLARAYSASWVFAACLLLGFLAKQISGRRRIGILVAIIALLTPWLFEVGRLVFETFFYPMALVLFLTSLYYAQRKQTWSWLNIGAITGGLMLLTYTYTIGRLLGVLMAGGLVLFASSAARLISILKTWVLFVLSLIPLLMFRLSHPEALTQRFYLISYIKPDSTWREIAPKFFKRYLEDLSLTYLLFTGDGNPRHHVTGSLGSFLIGAFALALIGLVVIIVRHWRESWWHFVLFGALISIVPGSLTSDQFHSLRLVSYPVFLLLLMVPALQFLLDGPLKANERASLTAAARKRWPIFARRLVLGLLLAVTAAQAVYFQNVFRREGPKRGWVFDEAYKEVYDAAVAQPIRPIYLIDGSSPSYVHAYWYATVEGRDYSEFVHLGELKAAPMSSVVLSSEDRCTNCVIIKKSGEYSVYRVLSNAMTIQQNDLSR